LKDQKKVKRSHRGAIRTRITLLFLIIVLALTSILTFVLYRQTSALVTREAADEASHTAEQAVQIIDTDGFVKLETIKDENSDPYIKMRSELEHIRAVSGAKFVFTMRKTEDGKFMYVVDGSTMDGYSHLGDTEESNPQYEKAWSGEPYTDSGIHHEEGWGTLLSSYYPIKNDAGTVIGILGVDYDVEDIYGELNNFKVTCYTLILVFGVIILISGLILSNSISKPIINAAEYSKTLAELDLTSEVPLEMLNRKDELGDLAKALSSITQSFRDMIGKIHNHSEQLAASAQKFAAASQESATAAEEVTRSVEEISKGASEQAQNTEKGALEAIELGKIVDEDVGYAQNINRVTGKVTEVVQEGLAEIQKLSEITNENNLANKAINDVILQTNDSAGKISEASNFIASISEQTNLLALNAAIEAARAGESGRGFAVVADEIRKLSEQSASSVQTIEGIVSELQTNVQNAVDTMKRISEITKEQTESVVRNQHKYKLVEEAMEESQKAIIKLNSAGQQMAGMKNDILETLQNLSSIAQENSAGTEEVTASMEEQAASMKEMASVSENLSQLAQDLQNAVAQFNI